MKISVVVPAYNEEKLLGESLRRMREGVAVWEEAGWETEWVVCDNNSSDGTAAIARAAGARVVFEPVNQIGRARNCGARAAAGDWLLFVDADSAPGRELCGEAMAAMERGDVVAGGATIALDDARPTARVLVKFWNLISRRLRWVAGSFIFCRRDVFLEVGGFSEALFAGEEIEFCRRLKRRARSDGMRVVILSRFPLVTSGRKVRLYSGWEHVRFACRALLFPGRTLRDRSACHTWYDGRR